MSIATSQSQNTLAGVIRDFSPGMKGPFITLRGVALLLFVLFLLAGPVPEESDIVAAVMAFTLLGTILLTLALTLANFWILKRQLVIRMGETGGAGDTDDSTKSLFSDEPIHHIVTVEAGPIFPFFTLSLRLHFTQAGVGTATHILSGKFSNKGELRRYLEEILEFPHRGRWECSSIRLTFGDQPGLTRIVWELSGDSIRRIFPISPPRQISTSLPVMSSSTRSGDTVSDLNERRGDPYDLRRYHPSDGMKKILWKIYAKTGELISRHPERSMTPEGLVLIYALASETDDLVCSSVLAYMERLEGLDLELFFGCEGMGDRDVARDPESAHELCIDSVWDSASATDDVRKRELSALLESVTAGRADVQIDRVLIFASSDRPRGIPGALLPLAESLQELQIAPVFCMIPTRRHAASGKVQASATPSDSILSRYLRWFIAPPDESLPPEQPEEHYREFSEICAARGWHVILEHG